jgi:hypothetical protein
MPFSQGEHHTGFDITLAATLTEDVNQEIWLLQQSGKNPRRDLVRKRLESRLVEGIFSDIPDGIDVQLPWLDYRPISLESIEFLVEWSLSQVKEVQQIIWNFLEDPEDQLQPTLELLMELGIIEEIPQPKPQVTIKDLILKSLPATFDDLVQLVLMVSPNTRRPEATIRQFIRRHQRSGAIKLKEGKIHHGK